MEVFNITSKKMQKLSALKELLKKNVEEMPELEV